MVFYARRLLRNIKYIWDQSLLFSELLSAPTHTRRQRKNHSCFRHGRFDLMFICCEVIIGPLIFPLHAPHHQPGAGGRMFFLFYQPDWLTRLATRGITFNLKYGFAFCDYHDYSQIFIFKLDIQYFNIHLPKSLFKTFISYVWACCILCIFNNNL